MARVTYQVERASGARNGNAYTDRSERQETNARVHSRRIRQSCSPCLSFKYAIVSPYLAMVSMRPVRSTTPGRSAPPSQSGRYLGNLTTGNQSRCESDSTYVTRGAYDITAAACNYHFEPKYKNHFDEMLINKRSFFSGPKWYSTTSSMDLTMAPLKQTNVQLQK